jgi:hypothetical protein
MAGNLCGFQNGLYACVDVTRRDGKVDTGYINVGFRACAEFNGTYSRPKMYLQNTKFSEGKDQAR